MNSHVPVQLRFAQLGMSLIEILVGLVIGMVGMLVIFQTMVIWGGRTATTVSGLDVRTSGALGMFDLERDLKQAGGGIGVTNTANRKLGKACDLTPTGGTRNLLVAVVITQGAPDTIRLLYGTADYSSNADFKPDATPGGAGKFESDQGLGFKKDDWVILANTTTCEIARIKNKAAAAVANENTLNHIEFVATPGVSAGNMLNLGGDPQWVSWGVSAGGLTRTTWDFVTKAEVSVPGQIADGVIDLQAEYGLVIPPATTITWSDGPLNADAYGNLRAVRVAMLVRSKQYEKSDTWTAPNPKWGDGFDFTMTDPADGTAWQRYRYEVFERVIPLRNLIWGAQSQ